MNKLIILSTGLFLFLFCQSNSKDNNNELDYCDCEMLAHDDLRNHFYLENRDEPYSGVCKMFYKNGQLKVERELVNGKNNGFYRSFSETGVLLEEGTFLDNRHQGWFSYYDETGDLIIAVEYNQGIPVTERAQD